MKQLVFSIAAVLALVPAAAGAANPDELIEADKAFVLSTRTVDAGTIEASWKIAPGYYLYRDKFKFEALDDAIEVKAPSMPAGRQKQDPFFGNAEIYTDSVKITLPIERKDQAAREARVQITAQGCNAPVGVCYPPIVKEIVFRLPLGRRVAVSAP